MALIKCKECSNEMSDSAPVCPNCGRPNSNAAPEKRPVSALLGVGILFIPFIFSWFTLREGHSVLARTLSFSWLFLFVVMIGAQDGTENRVASTSGSVSTEARQVNSKSNEATPDLEVKSQGNIDPPSRSILHRLFNPDYPTQHPDEYPVSNATYSDVTSKTGCESKYSDAKKSDIFDSDYKNHWLTWKGTVELADASSASLNLDGKGIQDLKVEFSNSNAGYNLNKGSVITVKFLMKTSGGCILPYSGTDGKIM